MTTTLRPTVVPSAGRRRALVAACAGNTVEWYDFALFGGTATVMAAVLTPGGWSGFITVFAVFATSCLFRPLGSLIFGARADRWGRKPTLAATILLMALATAAIGLLPPWSAIGLAAPLCLLGLRAAQAFSAGGEISVSVAYLTEFSPPGRRGRDGGWYLSTVAVGIAAGLGATAVVAAVIGQDALYGWGWRVPFLLALPLGLVGLYLRRRVDESPAFAAQPDRGRVRCRQIIAAHLPALRRCLVLAGAYAAAFNVWFIFLPSYVTATGASTLPRSLTCALAGLAACAIAAPLFGRMSDRWGRRPLLASTTGVLAVTVIPLYLWMMAGSTAALLVGSVAVGLIIAAFVLPAFISEQFPVAVRATGIGLAFGVSSAVIGGTAPLIATVLARQLAPVFVPGYVAILAVAGLVAVLRSPETVPSRLGDPQQTASLDGNPAHGLDRASKGGG